MKINNSALYIIILSLFVLNSCGKDEKILDKNELEKDDISLLFTVNEENEFQSQDATYNPKIASSSVNNLKNSINQNNEVGEAVVYDDIEMYPVVDHNITSYSSTYLNQNKGLEASKVAVIRNTTTNSFVALQNGFTIRVLLYLKDNASPTGFGEFLSSAQYTVGANGAIVGGIKAKKGKTYKYIIYTMNDDSNVPDVSNPNNPIFMTFVNRDFAYQTGEFTTRNIQAGDTGNETMQLPAPVNLIRQVARVGIALNTLGMFATVNSAKVALSESNPSFRKGAFNLKTGEYIHTQISDYTGGDLVADVNKPIPGGGNYNKVAFFYTAEVDEVKRKYPNLSVVVKNFTLNLDWATEKRSFGENIPGSSEQTILFANGISAQRGVTHYGTINMVESALNYAGVKWSRTNLMYDNTNKIYGFRHFPDRRYIESGGNTVRNQEFWMLGAKASVAAGTSGSNSLGGTDLNDDPCRRVYPYNLWVTASRGDWDALYSASGTQVGTGNNTRRTVYNTTGSNPYWGQFTGVNNTYFIAYKATTGSTPYPNNGDLIYALGGVMQSNGNMFTLNVTANYFPREFITQSKSAGRDVFVLSRGSFTIGTQNVIATTNEMWVGWAKATPSLGRPTIRCVRNTNISQVNFTPVSDPTTLAVQN